MNTKQFLSELETKNPNSELIFSFGNRHVKAGYHVTEVKAASVQSMACGGQGNTWHETTLQLWAPDRTDESYMSIAKFLSIYSKVSSSITVNEQAQMRVEYGDIGSPAISYVVADIETNESTVTVKLNTPTVACKANDRSFGDIAVIGNNANCCTANPLQEANQDLNPVAKSSSCC